MPLSVKPELKKSSIREIVTSMKAKREKKGLTQAQAAEQIGISPATYVKAELYGIFRGRSQQLILDWVNK